MAVNDYTAQLGLDTMPFDGLDPVLWVELNKVYNAIANLARYVDQAAHVTGELDTDSVPAGTVVIQDYLRLRVKAAELIPAGYFCYMHKVADELVVSLADSSSYLSAPDCFSVEEIASGEYGEVRLGGIHRITGLVPGTKYYIHSSLPGQITDVAPAHGQQDEIYVGIAVSAEDLYTNMLRNPFVS